MLLKNNTNKWRLAYGLALFFTCSSLLSQQSYFQQEVNYKINVVLNDKNHSLSAFENIQYINKAAQSLNYIYFHLWPNAYKNNSTALSKQLLQQKKTDLYFSKADERGYIDSLDFKVNGKSIAWEFDKQNPDICKLKLNEPLKSLDTIIITTPFFVKIPDAKFSRLGHDGQAYFITQWYPKPAVFDNSGWHQMPYLDQGEFFSEFGSFDVSITLPENYLLAATGDRIDANKEETFLNNKVIETLARFDNNDYRKTDMDFPESSNRYKTVRFKQFRVHDFAWFADKRFNVIHDQIELPVSRRVIDTWVFFTNKNFELWKNAINNVNESTYLYSYLNGDYPYNHVTAVDGTIMAGGGMEYPNITVIGDMENEHDLDITIAHEVGHNWFYGILGSNERYNPAMDEGINSFYEMRYARAKYPEKKLSSMIGRDSTFKLFKLNKTPYWKEKEFGFYLALKSRTDQALNLPAQNFTAFNYGSIVYYKTAIAFDYLMDYMGEENLDKAMRFYYEQFRFKHPSPDDLIKTLNFFSGTDLTWFVKHLLTSTDHIDYKIKKVKQNQDGSFSIKVKNKTGTQTPINIYGYKNSKPVGLIWYNGFEKNKTLEFPPTDVDYFKIDGLDKMPDINRNNNYIKAHGLFKKSKPLQLNFITALENPAKTQVNYLPVAGVNAYNGFMVGVVFHNYGFYQKKTDWLIAPMYAFNSKTPAGFVEFNHNVYPKKTFQQISLGAKGKTFSYNYFSAASTNQTFGTNYGNIYYNYYKIAPYVQVELKKKVATSSIQQFITYSSIQLFCDSLAQPTQSNFATEAPRKKNIHSFVNQLDYNISNKRIIQPFSFNLNMQHTAAMAKVSGTFSLQLTLSKKHYVDIRIFAGAFLAGNENEKSYYAFRPDGYNGSDDYLFETNFFARNETSGLGYSQFTEKDGALKIPVLYGNSSQWMANLNLKSPQLFILPVKVFVDVMATDGRNLKNEQILWDTGLNITLIKDIIEVYIPVLYSQDIKEQLDLNKVSKANRIRFTLNIHKLVPKDFIKNNLF